MYKSLVNQSVGGFTYFLFITFIISFFLHLPSRIPAIAPIRPDLMLVILISIMLFFESSKLKGRLNNQCSRILIIFIAYIILSIPFVEWPGSVLRENFADFVKVAVFFFFTVLIVDTDKRLRFLILVFILCQLFRALEPLYLYMVTGELTGYTHLGGGEFAGRLSGSKYDVINANGLGFVIATVFPFIHFLWGTSNWKRKLLYFSVAPALLYALVLTLSRSGFIAMLIIVWNIFTKSKNKIFLIIVVIVISVFSWSQMSDNQRDRYKSLTGDESTKSSVTFEGRIRGMISDFKLSFKRPIVGHGIGTSKEANWNVKQSDQISHILYAEIIIETGIIGFVIFILFMKAVYNSLRRVARLFIAAENKYNDEFIKDKISDYEYKKKLINALNACFWMYLIFSLAQYGLSEYHWYFLAALSVLCEKISTQTLPEGKNKKSKLASYEKR